MGEKTQFIEPYKKMAVLEKGKLIRLYWAHSSKDDIIDMNAVLSVWNTIPGWAHRESEIQFLVERGYHPIVDGITLDMEKLTKRGGIQRA